VRRSTPRTLAATGGKSIGDVLKTEADEAGGLCRHARHRPLQLLKDREFASLIARPATPTLSGGEQQPVTELSKVRDITSSAARKRRTRRMCSTSRRPAHGHVEKLIHVLHRLANGGRQ
jgi:excinuclease UvrABC ATPase subunit